MDSFCTCIYRRKTALPSASVPPPAWTDDSGGTVCLEADATYSFSASGRLERTVMDLQHAGKLDLMPLITHELPFAVRGETRELGVCRLRHRWSP